MPKMLRQLRSVLVDSGSVLHLKRAGDTLVESQSARRDQFVIQRLAEERVREAIAD
jgi:hypothetical protein